MPSSPNQLDLKRSIGDTIQLQFFPAQDNEKYYVKILGYLINKSIIVSMPRIAGQSIKVNKEQQFIVRLVSGQTAQGFTTTVLHTTRHPYPHLHLSYPENLESITVRKSKRVNCTLIVSINKFTDQNTDKTPNTSGISASMTDISSTGAQLAVNEAIGNTNDTIEINCKINIADITQYLNITGIIRRVSDKTEKNATKYEYGIEFDITEDSEKVLLHAFIYEQMLHF